MNEIVTQLITAQANLATATTAIYTETMQDGKPSRIAVARLSVVSDQLRTLVEAIEKMS